MPDDLLTPILTDGLRRLHFFNGRVLTAEDFLAEQTALRLRDERLGRAIGEGIVDGLEVRLKTDVAPRTVVVVEPGLAVSRGGQVLELPLQQQVSVVPAGAAAALGAGAFAPCGPAATVTPAGFGAYVLVMAPASGLKGRVPFVGIADDGVAANCDRRFRVEGVQFRLVHLDTADTSLLSEPLSEAIQGLIAVTSPSEAQEARLRNLLAHWCLGTSARQTGVAALYDQLSGSAGSTAYGPLETLRTRSQADPGDAAGLSDCDVPLALLHWAEGGLRFVDMWAVRRRLHRRAASLHAPLPTLDSSRADAQAALLQFQQHIANLTRSGRPVGLLNMMRARNHFRFLPPVGLVPERAGGTTGLNYLEFFDGLEIRDPVFVDDSRVPQLLLDSFSFPPIDLNSGELIWLYRVRGNRQPPSSLGAQPYLLFSSGQLPYRGDAQYALSYWNYSNYARGVADGD